MKSRSYVLKARGAATQATHQRILRAGIDLMWEKMSLDITLDDVALRSGVSVQTVLRHFGTREGLFSAVETSLQQEVVDERRVPAGDLPSAVRVLFDHYELRGDAVLRLLGQEFWNERIRAGMDIGRRTHWEWVAHAFAPQLGAYSKVECEELMDLLVVATDVYTWKLLRRDRALERQQAEERMLRLIAAILIEKKGMVTVQADPQCSTERRIEGWEQLQPVWKRHFTYDGRLLHHRLRRGSRSLSPLSPSEQGVQNALLRRDPTFYWVSA